MSEGLTLYALLMFLYFAECFVFSGYDDAIVTLAISGKRKISTMNALIGLTQKKITLLNPFTPFSLDYMANVPRLSLSPTGVCSYAIVDYLDTKRMSQEQTTCLYDDIKQICANDSTLMINGTFFVSCSCNEQARYYVDVVNNLKSLKSNDRVKYLLEVIGQQFSNEQILEEINTISSHLQWLRVACLLLFTGTFIVAPVAVLMYGLETMLIPIIFLLYSLAVPVAVLNYSAQKNLIKNSVWSRIASVIKIMLCPPMAIRLPSELSLTSLVRFHPIPVIDTNLGDTGLSFYTEALRKLLHPIQTRSENSVSNAIIDWYAEAEYNAFLHYGNTKYGTPFNSFGSDPMQESGSHSYCPRCLTQYTISVGTCSNCKGVMLRSFSS